MYLAHAWSSSGDQGSAPRTLRLWLRDAGAGSSPRVSEGAGSRRSVVDSQRQLRNWQGMANRQAL